MRHPQPTTPIQADNSTACGITNDNIKEQCSCAIDMQFYWVQDQIKQDHLPQKHQTAHLTIAYCEGVLIALGPKPPMHPKIQCTGMDVHAHPAPMVGPNSPTPTKLNHSTNP